MATNPGHKILLQTFWMILIFEFALSGKTAAIVLVRSTVGTHL